VDQKKFALALVLSAAVAGLGTACSAGTTTTATGGSTVTVTATPASDQGSTAPSSTGTGAAPTDAGVAPTQAAPTAASPRPVLGTTWASGVQGYGHARPSGLNGGGDPTGIVTNLTWSSWGGASAKGTGLAEYVAPDQSVAQGTEEKATVVAFDLGTCNGKKAYRAVEWYFPGRGQHFDPNRYFDACTGQDHGM
jgi:hypothetical protein